MEEDPKPMIMTVLGAVDPAGSEDVLGCSLANEVVLAKSSAKH